MKSETRHWTAVCDAADILPGTGVCARVGDAHVAIFHVAAPAPADRAAPPPRFYAIDNVDPRSHASVLSRGLVGSLGGRVVVASPLYKNHFDLASGQCLEMPEHAVRAHAVRIVDGRVQVALA